MARILWKSSQADSSAFSWHQDMWYAENGDFLKNAADPERVRQNETGITVWAANEACGKGSMSNFRARYEQRLCGRNTRRRTTPRAGFVTSRRRRLPIA